MDAGLAVLILVGLLLVAIFILLTEGRYFGEGLYRSLFGPREPPEET